LKAFCVCVQEDICETIYASLEQCYPALYLERAPLSVSDLRAGVPLSKSHVYEPRTVILAQLAGSDSVSRDSDGGGKSEQLADLFAYGGDEIWSCLRPGVDQHVSALSLYGRYRLAELLDHKDWTAASKALGLETPDTENEPAPVQVYSPTDGILADWAQSAGDAATIRALNAALQSLQRADVIDTLLSLTPLYRYVDNDNNNVELVVQGHQGRKGQGQGRQRQAPSASGDK